MTRRATSLSIPQPCAQSWDAMTPAGPGRHCAVCQKTVVDFTQKTTAEILAHLTQAAGLTCGRFRAGQLGQPLQPVKTTPSWRGTLGALLAGSGVLLGSTPRAAAQASTTTQQFVTVGAADKTAGELAHSLAANAEIGSQPADTLVEVRGIVLDAERCEPLPGVTVILKNTSQGTATNMQGEFALWIRPAEQPAQLLFRSIGFISQEQTVAFQGIAPRKLEVALASQAMGELLVSYSPPWPWSPRAFYHWGKFWLTRPFRQ